MQADKITVGVALKLKPERAKAYGASPFVYVTELFTRPGYKQVWVRGRANDAYPASDFAGFAE